MHPVRTPSLLAVLALVACLETSPEPTRSDDSGPTGEARDLALQVDAVDAQGLARRLEPSAGEKALLINFWATW